MNEVFIKRVTEIEERCSQSHDVETLKQELLNLTGLVKDLCITLDAEYGMDHPFRC